MRELCDGRYVESVLIGDMWKECFVIEGVWREYVV